MIRVGSIKPFVDYVSGVTIITWHDEDTKIVEYSYKGHGREYSQGDMTAEIDDLNTQSLETVNLWTYAGDAWQIVRTMQCAEYSTNGGYNDDNINCWGW